MKVKTASSGMPHYPPIPFQAGGVRPQEFEGLVGWIQSNFFCVGMIAILPLPKGGFSWFPFAKVGRG